MTLREAIWNGMLDADMNYRYYGYLAHRYSKREFYMKWVIACSSSASVAGWQFWADNLSVWKFLTSLTAVIAVASPLLSLDKKHQLSATLRERYYRIMTVNEKLFRQLDTSRAEDIEDAISELNNEISKLSAEETALDHDKSLLKYCQKEVCVSRGIKKQL